MKGGGRLTRSLGQRQQSIRELRDAFALRKPVQVHMIYRREQAQGGAFRSWGQAGMALERPALLSNQSQRREMEFRVIGVNNTGISVPKNTAAVVL
jgi:hypothetical protein